MLKHTFFYLFTNFWFYCLLIYLVQRTVGSGEISEPVTIIKCEFDDESFNLNDGRGGMSTNMALGAKTMTNNTFGNITDGLDCVVCGDRATGNKRDLVLKFEIFFF
jgi:hypothetical protein